MSVSSISPSSFFNSIPQGTQSTRQKLLQEFEQLGQDLKSGNLSAAQSDFAALQALGPQTSSTNSTSSAQSSNPISQAFNQLAQDLQAGNISAAQQDFSTLQQDFQSLKGRPQNHLHIHTGGFGGGVGDQAGYQLGRPVPDVNFTIDHTLPPVLDGSPQGGPPQANSISFNA